MQRQWPQSAAPDPLRPVRPSLPPPPPARQAKSAQNQDDGQRKRNELMQQLYRGMEVLEEEEQFEQFEDGQSFLLRALHRLQRWVKAHQPLQGDVRSSCAGLPPHSSPPPPAHPAGPFPQRLRRGLGPASPPTLASSAGLF